MGLSGKQIQRRKAVKVRPIGKDWQGNVKANVLPEGINFLPTANVSEIGLLPDGTIGVK